jgi:hypothetical protein
MMSAGVGLLSLRGKVHRLLNDAGNDFFVRQRLAHLHTERRPNLLGFQKERSFGRGHLHTKRLRCVAWGRGGRSRRWLRWCRDLRCVRRQKCVVLRVERTDGRDGLVVVSASKTGNIVSEFTPAFKLEELLLLMGNARSPWSCQRMCINDVGNAKPEVRNLPSCFLPMRSIASDAFL